MEVIRLIVVPIISLITGIMAVIILITTYYIVFKLKKYIKRYKLFLNFTTKLNANFLNKNVKILRVYKTIMWGNDLEETKSLIGTVLDNYKKSDIKDLILGTYKDDFNSVKKTVNQNYRLVKNNLGFLKFQKLFYVYKDKDVRIEYLDEYNLSFFKVERNSVLIGLLSKQLLDEKEINYQSNYDLTGIFKEELADKATIYRIYFFKNKFSFKEVQNGFKDFEDKLNKMKDVYLEVTKQKYHLQNVYLYKNLEGFEKIQSLLKKQNSSFKVVGDFLIEQVVQRPKIIDSSFMKDKREKKLEVENITKKEIIKR